MPMSIRRGSFVVVEGFTADVLMSSILGIKVVSLPTQADGFLALKHGRADAFVTARSTVTAFNCNLSR